MAGLYQPTREDIDAFLSLVPDIPETEVIARLKVTLCADRQVDFEAKLWREITTTLNKLLVNTLTTLALDKRQIHGRLDTRGQFTDALSSTSGVKRHSAAIVRVFKTMREYVSPWSLYLSIRTRLTSINSVQHTRCWWSWTICTVSWSSFTTTFSNEQQQITVE